MLVQSSLARGIERVNSQKINGYEIHVGYFCFYPYTTAINPVKHYLEN